MHLHETFTAELTLGPTCAGQLGSSKQINSATGEYLCLQCNNISKYYPAAEFFYSAVVHADVAGLGTRLLQGEAAYQLAPTSPFAAHQAWGEQPWLSGLTPGTLFQPGVL